MDKEKIQGEINSLVDKFCEIEMVGFVVYFTEIGEVFSEPQVISSVDEQETNKILDAMHEGRQAEKDVLIKVSEVSQEQCAMQSEQCASPELGMYIHSVCHRAWPTWVRYFPSGLHEVVCSKCRLILTSFYARPATENEKIYCRERMKLNRSQKPRDRE